MTRTSKTRSSTSLFVDDLDSSDYYPSLDLPIAFQKGKCQCTDPISSFVSCDHLSHTSNFFLLHP